MSCNALAPNKYTAKIYFAGVKDTYLKSSKTVKITVKKATAKLSAGAKTYKAKTKIKRYVVTLKDNLKKPLRNTKVTLKIRGKLYSVKTNSKGKATFKLTNLPKKGKYVAVVKYAGNAYYKSITKKPKITVRR